MHELLMAIVTNSSASFAFIILGLCVVPVVYMILVSVDKSTRISHQESMARMELAHREKMSEHPKQIEQKIQRNAGHVDRDDNSDRRGE